MVLHPREELLPLLERSVPVLLERLLCGHNSIVDILLGGDWQIPELLAGRRVWGAMLGLPVYGSAGEKNILTPWCFSFPLRFWPSMTL